MLVADDEAPAREELAWLLGRDPRGRRGAHRRAPAPRCCGRWTPTTVDALFLDIRMPGLDGLDVARVLARFRRPPQVVFVTAYDEHAVEAFDLRAVDYLLKPVRAERLAEAVRRVARGARRRRAQQPADPADDETIAVELGGVTRFVQRSDVRYVEAQGDYARLHTADGEPPAARTPDHPRGAAGPPPASSASIAATWSRCTTSTRCAWTPAGGRCGSATTCCRSAAGTPASCATCWSAGPGRAAP